MNVTDEMLQAAMKKAVELGLLPAFAGEEQYLKNWDNMQQVLEAAFEEIAQ